MLTNTVVKNSFPLFLMTLLVTSQLSGIKSVKASEETCCPCEGDSGWTSGLAALVAGGVTYFAGNAAAEYLGAGQEGVKKGSPVAKLQQFASKSGGLGSNVASTLQKAGTASGSRKLAAEMAGKAYNAARDKRCCPCHSKTDF